MNQNCLKWVCWGKGFFLMLGIIIATVDMCQAALFSARNDSMEPPPEVMASNRLDTGEPQIRSDLLAMGNEKKEDQAAFQELTFKKKLN